LQKNTAIPLDMPACKVTNKTVVVLGGGDTAMDCLRAAIRYGAREAVGIYRREEAAMPCARREYENALEEGARFEFGAAPVAILADGAGRVTGLRLIRSKSGPPDEEGRRAFTVCADTEFDFPADVVVTALGFEPLPCPHSGDFSELAVNDWGGIIVDKNQMTSIPGVFAGGDIVRGPSPILLAVRDARKAAEQIHTQLSQKQPGAKV